MRGRFSGFNVGPGSASRPKTAMARVVLTTRALLRGTVVRGTCSQAALNRGLGTFVVGLGLLMAGHGSVEGSTLLPFPGTHQHHEFGNVPVGQPVTTTVLIRNLRSRPADITISVHNIGHNIADATQAVTVLQDGNPVTYLALPPEADHVDVALTIRFTPQVVGNYYAFIRFGDPLASGTGTGDTGSTASRLDFFGTGVPPLGLVGHTVGELRPPFPPYVIHPATHFTLGERCIGISFQLSNVPANSQGRIILRRPDGTNASEGSFVLTFSEPESQYDGWAARCLTLDVPGTWQVLLEVNGTLLVSAPFTAAPPNTSPVASPQSVTTNEDTPASVTLSATDADGDALTYFLDSQPAHGKLSGTPPTLTYTPAADYSGSDSFSFKVSDGKSSSNVATVSITVNAVDDHPVAQDQGVVTDEDTVVEFTLAATDPDGGPRFYNVRSQPPHGDLVPVANAEGRFRYKPADNFHGSDSFTFSAGVAAGSEGRLATVTFTVNPVNDTPRATGQTVVTDEDTAASITLAGSDADGNLLTFTVSTLPSHGTLSGTAPNLTYTPNADYAGPDSFTFTASDGTATSAPATVSITVNPVNDPPVADAGGPYSVVEGGTVTLTGSGSDVDGDPLTYAWDLDGDGIFKTSGQNAVLSSSVLDGPSSKSVVLRVTDNHGETSSSVATINILNADPTISGVSSNGPVNEGSSVTVTVSASDPAGANDPLSYEFDFDNNGVYEVGPQPGSAASHTYADNGSYPVNVRVTDGDGGEATSSITVVVNNVNPTASVSGAPASSPEGTAISVTGSATDPSSVDTAAGFAYAWSVTKDGVAFASGSGSNLSFTPDDNGSYVVTLTVTDKDGGSGSDSRTITVTNVNPAASIDGAPASSPEGTAIILGSSVTDAGAADTHTYAWSVTKDGDPFASGADSSFTFTPDDNATYVVTLTVTDDDGGFDSNSQTITGTNVAPTVTSAAATPSTLIIAEPLTVSGGFSDPGVNDSLWETSINWGDSTAAAVFSVGSQGADAITHTRPSGYAGPGSYEIWIEVRDKDGGLSSVAKVPVTVSYKVVALYDQTKVHKLGSTVPIKLQLCDANGVNRSSSGILVTATRLEQENSVVEGTPVDSGSANPDSNFRYDAGLGGTGGYIYNLSTSGLSSGTWVLLFKAGNDPATHAVRFAIK